MISVNTKCWRKSYCVNTALVVCLRGKNCARAVIFLLSINKYTGFSSVRGYLGVVQTSEVDCLDPLRVEFKVKQPRSTLHAVVGRA